MPESHPSIQSIINTFVECLLKPSVAIPIGNIRQIAGHLIDVRTALKLADDAYVVTVVALLKRTHSLSLASSDLRLRNLEQNVERFIRSEGLTSERRGLVMAMIMLYKSLTTSKDLMVHIKPLLQ